MSQKPDVVFHAARLDEAARGDDGRDLGGGAGRRHVDRTRGEIQHGRHAAHGVKAEQREEAADGVGEQDADIGLAPRLHGHAAAENEAAHDQAVIAGGIALDVLQHSVTAAMRGPRVQQRLEQGAVDVRGAEHHVGHHVIELVGLMLAERRAAKALRRIELDGRQEGERDLREPAQPEFPAHARERRILGAVDPHGKHFGLGHLGNRSRPLIDLHERPGDGQAAFREDHHPVALFQFIDQGAERHRIRRVDGNHVEEIEGQPCPPVFRHMGVDGEAGALGQERREQRAIEQRGMVGDDHRLSSSSVEVFETLHFDPVEHAEQPLGDACHEFLRQQAADQDGGNAVGDRQRQEQPALRQMQYFQHHD